MLEPISEDVVRRGLKTGGVIDVSQHSPTMHFSRIVVTRLLWQSLLSPFPTAQPSDYISLPKLLDDLAESISSPFDAIFTPHLTTCSPRTKPSWLPDDFSVGVYQHASDYLLLFLQDEPLPSFPRLKTAPGSLLVKLLELISRLSFCLRNTDKRSLVRLLVRTNQLVACHPLGDHIHEYRAHRRQSVQYPQYLSREEYRAVLLKELGILTEVLACYVPLSTAFPFQYHYERFTSPTNELLHVTHSLLMLSLAVPEADRWLSCDDELFAIYSQLRQCWTKDETPKLHSGTFNQLQAISSLFAKLLPKTYEEQLHRIQQTLAVLKSMGDGFAAGMSYPPVFSIHQ